MCQIYIVQYLFMMLTLDCAETLDMMHKRSSFQHKCRATPERPVRSILSFLLFMI